MNEKEMVAFIAKTAAAAEMLWRYNGGASDAYYNGKAAACFAFKAKLTPEQVRDAWAPAFAAEEARILEKVRGLFLDPREPAANNSRQ